MRRSIFAGLTELDPQDALSIDGGSFKARNIQTVDQWLSQVVSHRHNNAAPISNPAQSVTLVALSAGGTLPTGTTAFVTYTVLDSQGGETAAAPVASVTTGNGLGTPASGLTAVVDNSAGAVMSNFYQYAYTLTDGLGGESALSDSLTVDRLPGPASAQIIFSGMLAILNATGAAGWRLYRATGGSQYALLAALGHQDGFTDTGNVAVDYATQPPDSDTSNQSGSITVRLPSGALASGVGFNLYLSASTTFADPSLYATYTASAAASTITITALATAAGSPPPVSTAVRGAHLIDPDTELLNWHWKSPVAASAALPSGTQGDVRLVVGASALYGVLGLSASAATNWTLLAGGGGGTGPAGPQGASGAIGLTGPQGASGAIGLTGPAGASGATGTSGATGAQGTQGPAGVSASANFVASAGNSSAIVGPFLGFQGSGAASASLSRSGASAIVTITVVDQGPAIGAIQVKDATQDTTLANLQASANVLTAHQAVEDAEITALGLASGTANVTLSVVAAEIVILGGASATASAAISATTLRDNLQDSEIGILGTASAAASARMDGISRKTASNVVVWTQASGYLARPGDLVVIEGAGFVIFPTTAQSQVGDQIAVVYATANGTNTTSVQTQTGQGTLAFGAGRTTVFNLPPLATAVFNYMQDFDGVFTWRRDEGTAFVASGGTGSAVVSDMSNNFNGLSGGGLGFAGGSGISVSVAPAASGVAVVTIGYPASAAAIAGQIHNAAASVPNGAAGTLSAIGLTGATVDFDTAGIWVDASSAWQPKTPGYYLATAIWTGAVAINDGQILDICVNKNGTPIAPFGRYSSGTNLAGPQLQATTIVFCNGTTDTLGISGGTTQAGETGTATFQIAALR